MTQQTTKPRNTRKIAAIAAGALVVGLGATYTLATWNDSEWVWGGADGAAGVGTSEFEVQQNTDPAVAEEFWTDAESNPGGEFTFTAGALALTPGDIIYAPVSLRTVDDSVAGTVTLNGAVAAEGIAIDDAGGSLWSEMRVSVYTATDTAPGACDATGVASWGTAIVDNAVLGTGSLVSQSLAANAGSTQLYCFAVTLPDGDPDVVDPLQGRTIAPAWEFASESVA